MNLERLSRLRQGVYRLAGAGFAYPTDDLIAAAAGSASVLDGFGLFEFSFGPAVARAGEALAESDSIEIEAAYLSLFEAGVGGAACAAEESVHRADPRTGGTAEILAELTRAYSRYGLKVDAIGSRSVDHISTEMSVMAMLCAQEAACHLADRPFGRVIRYEADFLGDHILRWVPSFARMVEESERHPAYSALAAAVRAFLSHERQLVPLIVEASTVYTA